MTYPSKSMPRVSHQGLLSSYLCFSTASSTV